MAQTIIFGLGITEIIIIIGMVFFVLVLYKPEVIEKKIFRKNKIKIGDSFWSHAGKGRAYSNLKLVDIEPYDSKNGLFKVFLEKGVTLFPVNMNFDSNDFNVLVKNNLGGVLGMSEVLCNIDADNSATDWDPKVYEQYPDLLEKVKQDVEPDVAKKLMVSKEFKDMFEGEKGSQQVVPSTPFRYQGE